MHTPAGRLGWLDALRGWAALTVVAFHASPSLLGTARHLEIMRHVDLGKYGVLLFFLVSGYVIPMSLERHGSLRRFWVGRLFRIYPAYLLAAALAAGLAAAGLLGWQAGLRAQPGTAVLAHATMLPDLLGLRGVLRVFWTLSYEMVFYLVVAGLFAWRLHRHAAVWAVLAAAVALLAGPALPDGLLAGHRSAAAAGLLLAVVLSVAGYLSGRRRAVLAAATAGVAFAALPAINGHAGPGSTVVASWQGLLLLAVMFAGTVVHRAQHGLLRPLPAAAVLAAVAAAVAGGHAAHLGTATARTVWATTVAAVAATFALGYALRHRAVPRVLTWLGAVSYSLYLLHVPVLHLTGRALPGLAVRPVPVRVLAAAGLLAASLLAAWAAYRLVELPGQRLGRRVAAALDARLGPDTPGGRAPAVPAVRRAGPGPQGPDPVVAGLRAPAPGGASSQRDDAVWVARQDPGRRSV